MKTESGSIRIVAPKRRSPAVSQVQMVEYSERCSGSRPSRPMKIPTVQRNERSVVPAAIRPATKRSMRSPSNVIARAPAAGEKSAVQARTSIRPSASERGEAVDVELDALPRDGDDEPESKHRLGRGDDH